MSAKIITMLPMRTLRQLFMPSGTCDENLVARVIQLEKMPKVVHLMGLSLLSVGGAQYPQAVLYLSSRSLHFG